VSGVVSIADGDEGALMVGSDFAVTGSCFCSMMTGTGAAAVEGSMITGVCDDDVVEVGGVSTVGASCVIGSSGRFCFSCGAVMDTTAETAPLALWWLASVWMGF